MFTTSLLLFQSVWEREWESEWVRSRWRIKRKTTQESENNPSLGFLLWLFYCLAEMKCLRLWVEVVVWTNWSWSRVHTHVCEKKSWTVNSEYVRVWWITFTVSWSFLVQVHVCRDGTIFGNFYFYVIFYKNKKRLSYKYRTTIRTNSIIDPKITLKLIKLNWCDFVKP